MKKLGLVTLLLAGLLVVSACGIPQDDYDAVKAGLDAAQAEMSSLQADLDTLIVTVDTVRGHIPSEYGPLCAQTSQWHRGELITWRARVFDPETGNNLPANPSELLANPPDADTLAEMASALTVTVYLSDGQSFPMHFGLHADADYFWTTSWEIPADYPTGVLNDYVTAEWTTEGKNGRSEGFQVPYAYLTILE